jgi:curved DNA-binding protein
MSAAKLTSDQARAILGLASDAAPQEVIGAFRAAAKQAHPDRPGGDAAKFREILDAYRLLQSPPGLPAALSAETPAVTTPYVEISPQTALAGGEAEAVMADGRRRRVRIPAGARHGERVSVGEETAQIRIASDAGLQVRGSDLWVTAEVAGFLLALGGRATVETPLGTRVLWINRKAAGRRLVRLAGEGLPARDPHPQGSLFIRLVPDTGPPESPARTQLKKFAAAWAA